MKEMSLREVGITTVEFKYIRMSGKDLWVVILSSLTEK